MIKELYCKNFKIFEEETDVHLSPLTVITGPNNSGKSTILDLVRLLSTDSDHPLYDINLSPGDHRNREFEKLLNRKESGELSVGYRFTPIFGRPEEVLFRNLLKDVESDKDLQFRLADDIYIISRFKSLNGNRYLASRELYLCAEDSRRPGTLLFSEHHALGDLEDATSPAPSREKDGSESEEENAGQAFTRQLEEALEAADQARPLPIERIWFGAPGEHGVIRETGPNDEKWDQRNRLVSSMNKYMPHSQDKKYRRRREIEWVFHSPLWKMALRILQEKHHLQGGDLGGFSVGDFSVTVSNQSSGHPSSAVHSEDSVPPRPISPLDESSLREMMRRSEASPPEWLPPHREDLWHEMLNEVVTPFIEFVDDSAGTGGMHIPSFRARPRRYYDPQDQLTDLLKQYQDTGGKRRKEVNQWLETFEVGSDLRVERIGPELFAAHVERNGERRYLSDLGSGSAQLLPLILSIGTKPPSRAFIEEPEANLHPNLQARLADLLVKLMDRGTQVVVETHSEYLVRRLQYLVAKGKCEPERASVAYLEGHDIDDETSPTIRHITIDQDGQLSESFGPGFFDQATNLMVDLFKYGSDN